MIGKPKVAYVDIETLPIEGSAWVAFEATFIEIIRHTSLLCFSWKIRGEKHPHWVGRSDFPRYKHNRRDDSLVVKKLWELFNEVDVLIGQNAKKFDIRKANAFFIHRGLGPPKPYNVIDTLQIARKHFGFDMNNLDELGNYLNVGRKIENEKGLWKKCRDGDLKAWDKMREYNKNDVELLERVYEKMSPWASGGEIFMDNLACTRCGSKRLEGRGEALTASGIVKHRFQCKDCGKWLQERNGERYSYPFKSI